MGFSGDPRVALWEKEWARIEAGEPPPSHENPPRRHHYVPEMYLRRFAAPVNGKKGKKTRRVRRIEARVGPSSAITIGVHDAAVETDVYSVETDDPRRVHEAEHIIGVFEPAAGYAFASLDRHTNDLPDDIDRENLSLYMALQFGRGPDTADFQTRIYTQTSRMIMKAAAARPDYVRNHLTEQGEDASDEAAARASSKFKDAAKTLSVAPHKNDTVATILRGPIDFMPYFFKRKWLIAKSTLPFLTSDRPILLHERQDPEDAWRGVGLGTADIIIFPLDRRRVLVMSHPLPESQEGVVDIDPQGTAAINRAIANRARRWLFHHPDDDPLAGIPFNPKGRSERRET
jgi:hypothetical protein